MRGICPECFTLVRLAEGRKCQPHRPNYATGTGCRGTGKEAKAELTRRQEQLVGLIELTVRAFNTSGMSNANSRRVALSVYWVLADENRWHLFAAP